jgi:hypothetical protein
MMGNAQCTISDQLVLLPRGWPPALRQMGWQASCGPSFILLSANRALGVRRGALFAGDASHRAATPHRSVNPADGAVKES